MQVQHAEGIHPEQAAGVSVPRTFGNLALGSGWRPAPCEHQLVLLP